MSWILVSVAVALAMPLAGLDLKGTVSDSRTGQPIRKAVVTISRAGTVDISTLSEPNGTFVFSGLEAGSYRLTGEATGYMPKRFGASLPDAAGRLIAISEAIVAPVRLQMLPLAVISGEVVDEDGDPLEHAAVIALRSDDLNAEVIITDAGGTFRFSDLALGAYRLIVNCNQVSTGSYRAPVWFRGKEIALLAGERLRFTIPAPRSQAFRLSGRIVPALGEDSRLYSIRLVPRGVTEDLGDAYRPEVIYQGASGEFVGQRIAEGDYILNVFRDGELTQALAYSAPLSLYADRADLLVQPAILPALRGKVQAEKPIERLTLSIERASPMLTRLLRRIPVAADGAFSVPNFAPGTYRADLRDGNNVPLLLANPEFQLRSGETDPIVLRILGTKPAVEVRAQNPATASIAYVFRDGPVLDNITQFETEAKATIFLDPGEYRIVTFEDIDLSLLSDPDFLRRAALRAKSITVKVGDRISLEAPTLPGRP